MAKLQLRFAQVLLWVALGTACSSKDDRSLIVVNVEVSADADIGALASAHIAVSKDGTEVKTFDVPWNQTAPHHMQVGLYMPSGIVGKVSVTASGRDKDGNPRFQSNIVDVDLRAGGTAAPIALILVPIGITPSSDGGADTAGPSDLAGAGAEAPDAGPSTRDAESADVGSSDAISDRPADVFAPGDDARDTGPSGDDARDAGPSGDDAKDGSAFPEVADGRDTAADVAVGPEAGHTRAWEPAQNIENDSVNPSYEPAIAIDPVNEHVYVAWDEATTVKVKRWNQAAGAWEKTATVETRGSPNTPGIGVDASGNVLLVWGQNTSTASVNGVWTSRTTDGSTWSPPARITSDPAFDIRLAVARNGTAHVVYNKQGSGWPLFTAYYDGTGWTENPTMLDPNPTSFYSEAHIALTGTGDGLLIFTKSWGVAGTALTGQTFSTPIMLDPNYASVTAYNHALAINGKGQGIALWTESPSNQNTQLLGRTYNLGVGWSSVLPPLVTSRTVEGTAVALDEQNNATLLWQQDGANGAELTGKHGSPTGTWSDPTALETDNLAGALNLSTEFASPSVAIDASGNVLAVWRKEVSPSTTTFGAYGTQYAGGSWLPQAKLGLKNGLDIVSLSVAVADSGFGAATFLYYTEQTSTDVDLGNVMVAFFR